MRRYLRDENPLFDRRTVKTAKVAGAAFGLWFVICAVVSLATSAAVIYALYAGGKWLLANQ